MNDDLVTHEQVARWLPEQIREDIAKSVPCFGGAEHKWHYSSIETRSMDSPFVTVYETWSCTVPGCEFVVRSEP